MSSCEKIFRAVRKLALYRGYSEYVAGGDDDPEIVDLAEVDDDLGADREDKLSFSGPGLPPLVVVFGSRFSKLYTDVNVGSLTNVGPHKMTRDFEHVCKKIREDRQTNSADVIIVLPDCFRDSVRVHDNLYGYRILFRSQVVSDPFDNPYVSLFHGRPAARRVDRKTYEEDVLRDKGLRLEPSKLPVIRYEDAWCGWLKLEVGDIVEISRTASFKTYRVVKK